MVHLITRPQSHSSICMGLRWPVTVPTGSAPNAIEWKHRQQGLCACICVNLRASIFLLVMVAFLDHRQPKAFDEIFTANQDKM